MEEAAASRVRVVAVAGTLVVLEGFAVRQSVPQEQVDERARKRGLVGKARTWYLVRRVLQTPVTSIMATKKGIAALGAMVTAGGGGSVRRGQVENRSGYQ